MRQVIIDLPFLKCWHAGMEENKHQNSFLKKQGQTLENGYLYVNLMPEVKILFSILPFSVVGLNKRVKYLIHHLKWQAGNTNLHNLFCIYNF